MADERPVALFSDLEGAEWQKEWEGMPEFVQGKERPYAQIIVRFRSKEDLEDFAGLIGQRLNKKSQCTWHPEFDKSESRHAGKVYIDES